MTSERPATLPRPLQVVSLFSGIGGLDLGLSRAGHNVLEMCESWDPARRVLATQFSDIPIASDVRTFQTDQDFDVLAAGFPCTDLSHAGSKSGIFGEASGLVKHAFRIAEANRPEWIVLENVPNLLLLHHGAGIAHIVSELERLGYRWAYRTIDTRFTGLPQRRSRVLIVASRSHSPHHALFEQDAGEPDSPSTAAVEGSGFYWTEGRQGVGLVPGAVPTLKGGSTLGLPSTPAIWFPNAPEGRRFVIPSVEDGEALQGFDRGWTKPALSGGGPDLRWKLIGNAVPVDVGHWVGTRLQPAGSPALSNVRELLPGHRWPQAAYGHDGRVWTADVSKWPLHVEPRPLVDHVEPTTATPLSYRASSGFLSRLDERNRGIGTAFYNDLEQHQQLMNFPLPGAEATGSQSRRLPNTPETRLLTELVARGVDFDRHTRPVKTSGARYPVTLADARVAVELRRCFWFDCPDHNSSLKLDRERWAGKIERNVQRAKARTEVLAEHGWTVYVVWEHDDIRETAIAIKALADGTISPPTLSPSTTTVGP